MAILDCGWMLPSKSWDARNPRAQFSNLEWKSPGVWQGVGIVIISVVGNHPFPFSNLLEPNYITTDKKYFINISNKP